MGRKVRCPFCRHGRRGSSVLELYCAACGVWPHDEGFRMWSRGEWRKVPEGTLLVLDRWSWKGARRR